METAALIDDGVDGAEVPPTISSGAGVSDGERGTIAAG
jgi:hypothetical protein